MQSLSAEEEFEILSEVKREVKQLQGKTELVIQWIHAHVGIAGNEKADKLSKSGSKQEQNSNNLDYKEIKTIVKTTLSNNWKKTHSLEENNIIEKLNRHAQVTIFRLRTDHCRLLSRMHRIKISHTDECPCGTGPQTPSSLPTI